MWPTAVWLLVMSTAVSGVLSNKDLPFSLRKKFGLMEPFSKSSPHTPGSLETPALIRRIRRPLKQNVIARVGEPFVSGMFDDNSMARAEERLFFRPGRPKLRPLKQKRPQFLKPAPPSYSPQPPPPPPPAPVNVVYTTQATSTSTYSTTTEAYTTTEVAYTTSTTTAASYVAPESPNYGFFDVNIPDFSSQFGDFNFDFPRLNATRFGSFFNNNGYNRPLQASSEPAYSPPDTYSPADTGYSAPEPTQSDYKPAEQEYTPPEPTYNAPEQSYEPAYQPPEPSYKPAEPSYKPPEAPYKPAEPAYKPPEPSYKPVEPSYKPPEVSYKPAEPAYKPPEASYKPAEPAYKPPEPAYKPVEPSYKPPEVSYKPAEPAYKPPEPAYKPTESSYSPAAPAYTAPEPSYKPPEAAYKPSEPVYKPPQSSYVRPYEPAYKPPESAYKPIDTSYNTDEDVYNSPIDSYGPSDSSYNLPQEIYSSVLDAYGSPLADSYGPPSDSYNPPSDSYNPPSDSYEPQSGYEAPSNSYDAPLSSSYGSPKYGTTTTTTTEAPAAYKPSAPSSSYTEQNAWKDETNSGFNFPSFGTYFDRNELKKNFAKELSDTFEIKKRSPVKTRQSSQAESSTYAPTAGPIYYKPLERADHRNRAQADKKRLSPVLRRDKPASNPGLERDLWQRRQSSGQTETGSNPFFSAMEAKQNGGSKEASRRQQDTPSFGHNFFDGFDFESEMEAMFNDDWGKKV